MNACILALDLNMVSHENFRLALSSASAEILRPRWGEALTSSGVCAPCAAAASPSLILTHSTACLILYDDVSGTPRRIESVPSLKQQCQGPGQLQQSLVGICIRGWWPRPSGRSCPSTTAAPAEEGVEQRKKNLERLMTSWALVFLF